MNRNLLHYQVEYAKQPYEKHQVAFRKQKIKSILNCYSHAKLLEVGCGLEAIFFDIADYEELFIIEPAPIFYEKAISDKNTFFNQKSIKIFNNLFEEVAESIQEVGFDFVLVSSLLHELPQPSAFLQSLKRVLSPKTVAHINVPNAKSFHRLLAVEMGLIRSEFQPSEANKQFQQHTIFDLQLLCQLVEEQGFEVVESGSYAFKPFTHRQMQHLIDEQFVSPEMLEGFYKMEKYLPDLGSEIYVNIVKNDTKF